MGKRDSPPPPDYTGAAKATAAANLEAAQAAQAANMVNQITPNGNLTYSQNPSSADVNGNHTYTATTTLSPEQQQIQQQTQALNSGLMSTAQTGLNYANGTLSAPGVDMSKLPSTGINPGQTYTDAMMKQLQPQIDRQTLATNNSLANQGIMEGSQAWKDSQNQLAQNNNNLEAQAVTSGMSNGLAANNQAFNQQAYNQMQPINVINALRTGSQVQNPSFVNTPQQQTTNGADLLGAAQGQYNATVGNVNAQNAQSASTASTVGTIGAGIMML